VVSVATEKDEVRVTYYREGKLATVSARAVICCAPKLIASRLISNLPAEHKAAMQHTRYAPYPVVNVIFDKPVYNRGYDTWCRETPSPTSSCRLDRAHTLGYHQKNNILTFYTPLREIQRFTLSTKTIARLSPRACSPISKSCSRIPRQSLEVRLYRPAIHVHGRSGIPKNRSPPRNLSTASSRQRRFPAALIPHQRIRPLSKSAAEWSAQVLAGNPNARRSTKGLGSRLPMNRARAMYTQISDVGGIF